MIFKIFYQTNQATPRRETTEILYLDVEAETELAGTIQVRELIAQKTDYLVEHIDLLSKACLTYDQEKNPEFQITEL